MKTLHQSYALTCDVETAFGCLSSEAWPERKAAQLEDGSRLEEREELPAGGVRLHCTRGLPSGIPGFLQKVLPADGRAGQVDTWEPAGTDGVRKGTWVATVPGAPVEVQGTMRLEPAGSGCSYVIDGTAKVKIPLIGGKAESFIVDMTSTTTDKEADVLRAMVAGEKLS